MNQIKLPATIATIEISSICNAKCRWCTTGMKNRVCREEPQYMTPEHFERGLDRLFDLGWITKDTEIELYNWGEPFLNPQLDDILRVLVKKELRYYLSTNGSIYHKLPVEVVPNMIRLMVSIPGVSQAAYDKIHQLRADKVQENIRKFGSDLREYQANEKLVINFHVYQFNMEEIDDARELAENIGGGTFAPHTAYFADYRLFQDYMLGKLDYANLRDAASQLFLDFYKPGKPEDGYECGLWRQICFDHEFNVVPCCFLTTNEQLGNLFHDEPEKLLKNRQNYAECEKCMACGQSYQIMHMPAPMYYRMRDAMRREFEQERMRMQADRDNMQLERERLQEELFISVESKRRSEEKLLKQLEVTAEAKQQAEVQLHEIQKSLSWRMTKPLRYAKALLRRETTK